MNNRFFVFLFFLNFCYMVVLVFVGYVIIGGFFCFWFKVEFFWYIIGIRSFWIIIIIVYLFFRFLVFILFLCLNFLLKFEYKKINDKKIKLSKNICKLFIFNFVSNICECFIKFVINIRKFIYGFVLLV